MILSVEFAYILSIFETFFSKFVYDLQQQKVSWL